jgi:hypothetical protein
LTLINFLNLRSANGEGEAGRLSFNDRRFRDPYLDVSGDGTVSAIDALLVINALNHGEAAPEVVDRVFLELGFDFPLDDEEEDELLFEDVPLLA